MSVIIRTKKMILLNFRLPFKINMSFLYVKKRGFKVWIQKPNRINFHYKLTWYTGRIIIKKHQPDTAL